MFSATAAWAEHSLRPSVEGLCHRRPRMVTGCLAPRDTVSKIGTVADPRSLTPCRRNGASFLTGTRTAAVMDTVNKPNVRKVCLWCGQTMADGPHGTSEDCIQALEAEIRRLSEQVKNLPSRKKGSR